MVVAIVWFATCFGAFHIFDKVWMSAARPQRVLGVFLVFTILFAPGTHRSEFGHLQSHAWGKKATHTVSWPKRPFNVAATIDHPMQPIQNDTNQHIHKESQTAKTEIK